MKIHTHPRRRCRVRLWGLRELDNLSFVISISKPFAVFQPSPPPPPLFFYFPPSLYLSISWLPVSTTSLDPSLPPSVSGWHSACVLTILRFLGMELAFHASPLSDRGRAQRRAVVRNYRCRRCQPSGWPLIKLLVIRPWRG